jgi:hypothetical protein
LYPHASAADSEGRISPSRAAMGCTTSHDAVAVAVTSSSSRPRARCSSASEPSPRRGDPAALCRERVALIHATADRRYALATAHAAYFRSLTAVGDTLWRFVASALAPAMPVSSPVLTLPPSPAKSVAAASASLPPSPSSTVSPLSHSLAEKQRIFREAVLKGSAGERTWSRAQATAAHSCIRIRFRVRALTRVNAGYGTLP